jgi:hypothetical protein
MLRAGARVEFGEECVGQQHRIVGALAQCGHADREAAQAVIEVFAQAAGGHRVQRIAIGGRDDAHFHRQVGLAADAPIAAEVEHAQQVRLQCRRHFGDFVEEERAVRGLFEESAVARDGAGEAAFLVPEQLAREQFARDRAAVHRDEGS